MPRSPLRIAILECDTPLDGTRAKYGSYGGVFTALLRAAAAASFDEDPASTLGPPPDYGLDISRFDVEKVEQYPRVEDVDAVLLTGSRNNAFDSKPWILKLVAFVRQLLIPREGGKGGGSRIPAIPPIRVIGVCFGHQIVGRALGTPCVRSDRGWETSVLPLRLTEKGKEIFGREELSLHQMHRDIVPSLPSFSHSQPDTATPSSSSPSSSSSSSTSPTPSSQHSDHPEITLLASSPSCDIQGFYSPRRLLTVQGHPEFNQEIVEELLESRHGQGIFDDAMFEDAMARVGHRQDGVVVGRAFLRFLME